MSKLRDIIFHCSMSEWGDVDVIRKWHVEGNGWRDIGYAGVILNGYRKNDKIYHPEEDGVLEVGRGFNLDSVVDSTERGAHAKGFNQESLGFCLIGDKKFTVNQFRTVLHLASGSIKRADI